MQGHHEEHQVHLGKWDKGEGLSWGRSTCPCELLVKSQPGLPSSGLLLVYLSPGAFQLVQLSVNMAPAAGIMRPKA